MWCVIFFFQAEDGIRDDLVTGVQTCALPISHMLEQGEQRFHVANARHVVDATGAVGEECRCENRKRSEERRVGKECRARLTADHINKKRDRYLTSRPRKIYKQDPCRVCEY